MGPADEPAQPWRPIRRTAGSFHPEQAGLPYLHLDWVTDINPLPTTGWDELDLEAPV